jgi:2-oxoglutarate dehydrogenase E2 component (dihydrolipoamide succinyltransferase)
VESCINCKEAVALRLVAEVTKNSGCRKEAVAAPVDFSDSENLYRLVKNIAKEEGVSVAELASISEQERR